MSTSIRKNTSFATPLKIIAAAAAAICVIAAITIFVLTRNTPDEARPAEETITTPGDSKPYNFDYSWAKNPYVAHAFGGILGDTYTNSYEAFLLNYQLGHRVFEVDFYITDDGKTVAAHDDESWAKNATLPSNLHTASTDDSTKTFTYNNFMSSLWYDKYHPVDLTTLLQILKEHPDIYIVTDTKFSDTEHVKQQFSAFYSAAAEVDLSLLDRFIPQIYLPEMLDDIMAIYPWKSVIYTLYANPNWTAENVLEFADQSGVNLITIPAGFVAEGIPELWQSSDLKIAVHTINQLDSVEKLRSFGISVFYTDFLAP